MGEQYKLRLGDGTILAVDHDGLRTWVLDEKAMVQPPGSHRWRPLKQLLAEEPAIRAAHPVRVESPAPPIVAPPIVAPPSMAPPIVAPPPVAAPRAAPPTVAPPIVAPPTAAPRVAPPPVAAPRAAPPIVAPPPVAPPTVAPRAAAPRAAPPSVEPLAAAPIATRPAEPAEPPRRPVLTPLAESTARVVVKADDGIPIIPFKPLDDEPSRGHSAEPESESLREVALAQVESHGGGELWQWSPPDGRGARAATPDAARRTAPPGAGGQREDLEDLELLPEDAVSAPPGFEALLAPIRVWVDGLLRRVRLALPSLAAFTSPPRAETPRRDVVPPPPISALPILRFAPTEEDGTVDPSVPAARLRTVRIWAKRALLVAGGGAVLIVATATRSSWMPRLGGLGGSADKAASPFPPGPPPVPEPPPLPKEVQVAIAQLPHLSPETVQLVMSGNEGGAADPPEVFRRAYIAASRGASLLAEPEALELQKLKNRVFGALRPRDRDRVRAYDRMSPVRDLLVGEDGKVLVLFARGVRALPAGDREHLQALLGKAIAAELARRASVAGR